MTETPTEYVVEESANDRADDGPEMTECPVCGYEMPDDDGFGFVYCRACGKCAHDSYEGGVCTICGEDDPDERRRLPYSGPAIMGDGSTNEDFVTVELSDIVAFEDALDTLTAERDDLLQRYEFMQAINAAYDGVCDKLTWLVKNYRQLWLDAKEATP